MPESVTLNEQPEPLVSQIRINGNSKCWGGENSASGKSSGTEIEYVVVPQDPKTPWTMSQAMAVAVDVRKQIHQFLLVDAKARGKDLPEQGLQTTRAYETLLESLKKNNGEVTWTERFNYNDPDGESGANPSGN